MSGSKEPKFYNKIQKAEYTLRLKNAIWTCRAFHFGWQDSLKFINSGMLGYRTNKEGEQLKADDGRPTPLTISQASYFNYKKEFEEMPQIYEDLGNFAISGYTKLMIGYQEELGTLHRMSTQNLLAKDLTPIERQSIIDSMVTKVITTESAFADMLKDATSNDPLIKKTLEERAKENAKHQVNTG